MDDTVGIDVEGYLDLRNPSGCRRYAGEFEASQGAVVGGHFPFSLENMDGNRRLIVRRRGEHLTLLGGNRGVLLDQFSENGTESLDTQGKGSYVQQKNIIHVSPENTALNRGPHGHHFIGIDPAMGFLAEEFLHRLLYRGDSRGAADEDHLIDIRGRISRILEGLDTGLLGTLNEIGGHLIELRTAQTVLKMFRARSIGGDKGQIDIRALGARKLLLRLFGRFFQALQGHTVLGKIDSLIFPEFLHQPVDDFLIEIVAAEMCVAVGGTYFENTVSQIENGDIEGAAA